MSGFSLSFRTIKKLSDLGFKFIATGGTSSFLNSNDINCERVLKVLEGRPHCVDKIRSGEVCMVVNTTSGKQSIKASYSIRRSCLDFSIPCLTESEAAKAYVLALEENISGHVDVMPLNLSL